MLVYYVCGFGGQKRALDPLEQDLQMVVRSQVGMGLEPKSFVRTHSAKHLSRPQPSILLLKD